MITSEWPTSSSSKSLQIISAGVEKGEPSGSVSENVNWCSYYRKQFGGFLKT